MKLLWITPECPFPPNTGGRVGIWQRLVNLSASNDIYLYTIIDDESEKQYESYIDKYCKNVKFYSRKGKASSLFLSLFYPYPAVSRWNKKLKEDLQKDYDKIIPDFVIVDFPQMIGALPDNIINSNRLVLNEHNIEFLSMNSLSNDLSGVKKDIYKVVAKQLESYETKIYKKNKVSLYTFVSSADKEYFEKRFKVNNTFLVPVGAEVKETDIIKGCHNLIFVAKMSYPANEEGALWLINEVFPIIQKAIPDAKLYLVGKDPGKKLYEGSKTNQNVIVTGTVDDLQPYYDQCNLVVVPIMTGGGVNVKLLEALGQDKYVVTTSKGIEGTDFVDGKDIRVANNSEDFANYCINVLNDPNSSDNLTMRNNVHRKMLNEYSWRGIMSSFEKELLKIRNQRLSDCHESKFI